MNILSKVAYSLSLVLLLSGSLAQAHYESTYANPEIDTVEVAPFDGQDGILVNDEGEEEEFEIAAGPGTNLRIPGSHVLGTFHYVD